jgi:predicted nucleotidyltransferase
MSHVEQTVRRYFEGTAPPGVVSAYLFGSHGRGEAHRESDVDVGVLLDRPWFPDRATRGRAAERLATALIAATHRNAVDVVVLNDAPPELAVAAVAGVRVYAADAAADHAFVRTALLRLGDLRPFLARTRRTKLEVLAR